jgi:hypothetical protein
VTQAIGEPREPYSPHLRTALVFAGTGTDGAYHAGVLRALQEAGIKIDLVAGAGIGAAAALFAAIDASAQLSADTSFWRSPASAKLYPVRHFPKAIFFLLAASLLSVIVPLLAVVAGLLVFPGAYFLSLFGLGIGAEASRGVVTWLYGLFEPAALPSILPRIAVVSLMAALVALLGAAVVARMRDARVEGAFWWTGLGPLLDVWPAIVEWRERLWRALAGGPLGKQPGNRDLSGRYVDVLAENLGQPGFRELLLVVHDLDARRDLVFALLAERLRREFFSKRGAGGPRSAEAFDLAGVAREHLVDVLSASLCLPVITAAYPLPFRPDGYWRGETHRLTARPGSVTRLIEEVDRAGATQIIVVAGAPESPGPHGQRERAGDARNQVGEYMTSVEGADVRDAVAAALESRKNVYLIQPAYNPLNGLSFGGRFDRLSNRHSTLAELVERGYEDAHRQFIEPVVATV